LRLKVLFFAAILILAIVLILAGSLFFSPSFLDQAKEAEKRGDYDLAIDLYKRFLDSEPKNHDARWHLIAIYEKQNRIDDETAEIKIFLEDFKFSSHPRELEAHIKLAKNYYLAGKWEDFYLELRKVIFFDSTHTESIFFTGVFYAANDLISRAVEALTTVLEREPQNNAALIYLSLCLVFRSESDKAEYHLNQILKSDQSHPDAHFLIACLKKSREPDEALRHLDKCLASSNFRHTLRAVLLKSFILTDMHKYEEAADLLLRYPPDEKTNKDIAADLLLTHAWAAHMAGRKNESVQCWEDLVKINFSYMELYAQYNLNNIFSMEIVEHKWRDRFEMFHCPSPTAYLENYANVNLRNLDSIYDDWELCKMNKGLPSKGPVTCYTLTDFRKLSLSELLGFSKKIVEKMGYRVAQEMESKEGYDCITKKDYNDRVFFVQIRNWSSVTSDVPVRNLAEKMEKEGLRNGVLVIAGDFTNKAIKLGMDLGINLVDKDELNALVFKN
jgi:tetratricopeptide (TPR) repeat protein